MILSYFEDPADPFKMQMPKIYSEAKEKLDELVSLKDTAKETAQFGYCRQKSTEFLRRLGDKSLGNSLVKLLNHSQHESSHDTFMILGHLVVMLATCRRNMHLGLKAIAGR